MFKHECNGDDISDNDEWDEFGDVEEEIYNDEGEVHDSVNRTFQNSSKVNINTPEQLFGCRLCDIKGATKVEHD